MKKRVIGGALLALVCVGWRTVTVLASPTTRFKEEALSLKYCATTGEAAIVVEAECEESLSRVEVWSPKGSPMFRVSGAQGFGSAVSGFVVETQEGTLISITEGFGPGEYSLRGRTLSGETVVGGATLSHELPPAPVLTYPVEGAGNVSTSNLSVNWVADPAVSSYRVSLEQGESDGLVITLPAGSNSFQVPNGFLISNARSQLELTAVAPNGNSTTVEVFFRTL